MEYHAAQLIGILHLCLLLAPHIAPRCWYIFDVETPTVDHYPWDVLVCGLKRAGLFSCCPLQCISPAPCTRTTHSFDLQAQLPCAAVSFEKSETLPSHDMLAWQRHAISLDSLHVLAYHTAYVTCQAQFPSAALCHEACRRNHFVTGHSGICMPFQLSRCI